MSNRRTSAKRSSTSHTMKKSYLYGKQKPFNDKHAPTMYNRQKNTPFIKSQRLPPITFHTQLTNIKKKWNTTPLYSGVLGSNYSTLLKNKEKPRNPTAYNTYNYLPEIKNYNNEISKPIQMNKNNIINSRFPDKCIGNCFTTEANTNYKKYSNYSIKHLEFELGVI